MPSNAPAHLLVRAARGEAAEDPPADAVVMLGCGMTSPLTSVQGRG
jgi:hypothetical protein